MAGLIPGPEVTGPEPLRRRYGLFTAASGPVDLPSPHGRGGGVRYMPRSCGASDAYPIQCTDGDVDTDTSKTGDEHDDLVEADPFVVYSTIDCGRVGYTQQEYRDKVERRLRNGEQGAVEHAVWTGEDRSGTTLDIASFQSEATSITVPDDESIVTVVATLEDWIYRQQMYGNVAYIHAPARVASYAAAADLVVRDNNLLLTPYGSVWVFAGGYPGTGAGGAEPPTGGAYLHVTGQTTVWRSQDVSTFPVDQTMNRETNQVMLLSEREYAVGFDCATGRAEFNPLGVS